MQAIKFKNDGQWEEFFSAEEFRKAYPLPQEGKYLPQPTKEPMKYPCLSLEAGLRYNPVGSDILMMVYIYDYEIIEGE